jgi:mannose-6-phosphate isomerase-like protein (cupin superfamily)
MNQPATIRKPGAGRRVGVLGDVYRFLATGDETDGKYATFECTVLPGNGTPPHIHSREEESFFILDGEMTFQLGDDSFAAEAGTFLNMPAGSLHCFRNESGATARILVTVAPAGLERMFFEAGEPLADDAETAPPPSPADIERLLTAATRYGIEIKVPDAATSG